MGSKAGKLSGQRLTTANTQLLVFVVVGEEYACMIHRFQKFQRQLQPGLNFIIPFVD